MVEKIQQRPTIDDVAREAGVSTATVSRVINQTVPVAPQTVERVQAAISTLNYHPQAAARILASRKTNTLGLLLPEISNYFFLPMILGIESGAHERGYSLLIHSSLSPERKSSGQLPIGLGEHNADGLIVFAHSLNDDELHRLNASGLPLVLLHQSPPPSLAIPNVTFENKNGARQLVEHLIVEHGYRNIAFLAGPAEHEDSYWREMGYVEALHAYGIEPNPALKIEGNFDAQHARQSVTQLLGTNVDVDAIFAADDESASGAMMALRDMGIWVPEEMAVVGFDDTLLATHLTPPLTTVHAPIEEAGRKAVELLINLIDGEPTDAITLLPTELIIRQSCGCKYIGN